MWLVHSLRDVMRARCVFVLLGACGSVAGEKLDAAVQIDAPPSIDAMIDAPPPARCSASAAFGAPVAITELNTTMQDEGATLSPDELTIYFSSTRTGTLGDYDIFTATRSSATAMWGTATPLAGVNTAGRERYPMISSDGLTIYVLTGMATGSPNYQLSFATRASTSSTFGALAEVSTLNTTSNDEVGTILPNAIYIASDRNGAGYDLFRAPGSGSTFSTPLPVSGVNLNLAGMTESNAVVTPNELVLFFHSNRAPQVGGGDIWVASRTDVANGFDAPTNVQVLNTTALDVPTWVSADGCNLYITSIISGTYNLYVSSRGM
jgi:hypothetical protein